MKYRITLFLLILILPVSGIFCDGASQSDTQNFQVVGYIPERSNIFPNGDVEYYGHLIVRNLYNAYNIEDGSVIDIGMGSDLFSGLVPMFRVEYSTNYLNPVSIKVDIEPFTEYEKDENEKLVPGDVVLRTKVKPIAGFEASYDTLRNYLNYAYNIPANVNGDYENKPSTTPSNGMSMHIKRNESETFSTGGDNYKLQWGDIPESSSFYTTYEDSFVFSFMTTVVQGYWGFVQDGWGENSSWKYYVTQVNDTSRPLNTCLPDGEYVTTYVEYLAGIDDSVPVPGGGDTLIYRMNVTVTVEAGV